MVTEGVKKGVKRVRQKRIGEEEGVCRHSTSVK